MNLPVEVFREIMRLVESGVYTTPEQFMAVAAFNQVALERSAVESDALSKRTAATSGSLPKQRKEVSGQRSGTPLRATGEKRIGFAPEDLDRVFTRLDLKKCRNISVDCCPIPDGTGHQRLWGQVNRLFPLKLVCRWIAAYASENSAWPRLAVVLDQIPRDIGVVGSYLEGLDRSTARSREDAHSAGLPRVGNLASSDRFISQFVARVTRADRAHPGAAFHLAFACMAGEEVALTSAGLKLALLPNSVIDADSHTANQTLSSEERALIIEHIISTVPAERNDMAVVARAIHDGHVSPTGLLSYIRRDFPSDWSDLAFRTHVYGILARLAELGQIARVRAGRTVSYHLPESAYDLLTYTLRDSRRAS